MVKGKRGQITYEYLIIVGMLVMLVLPFFNYAFYTLGGHTVISSGAAKTVQLAASLEEISYLGSGNVKTIEMDDVKSIDITANGDVTTTLENGGEITLPSFVPVRDGQLRGGSVSLANKNGEIIVVNTPVIGWVEPRTPGTHQLRVEGRYFGDEPRFVVDARESGGGRNVYEASEEEREEDGTQKVRFLSSVNLQEGEYDVYAVVEDIIYSSPYVLRVED